MVLAVEFGRLASMLRSSGKPPPYEFPKVVECTVHSCVATVVVFPVANQFDVGLSENAIGQPSRLAQWWPLRLLPFRGLESPEARSGGRDAVKVQQSRTRQVSVGTWWPS